MTTNREKLNQMTNEELAEILAMSSRSCKYCKYEDSGCYDSTCYSGILQWLNQESEENNDMENK